MPSMTYCAFRNTFQELLQVEELLSDGDWSDTSPEELRAVNRVIKLCELIAEEYEEINIEEIIKEQEEDE